MDIIECQNRGDQIQFGILFFRLEPEEYRSTPLQLSFGLKEILTHWGRMELSEGTGADLFYLFLLCQVLSSLLIFLNGTETRWPPFVGLDKRPYL